MKYLYIFFIFIGLLLTCFIAQVPRHQFWYFLLGLSAYILLYIFSALFFHKAVFYKAEKKFDAPQTSNLFFLQRHFYKIPIDVLIVVAINFLVVFSVPNLSDDVYRFVWDGAVLGAGVHPLAHTPIAILNSQQQLVSPAVFSYLKAIYPLLNSPNYYTVYPSFLQFIFYISGFFSNNNLYINILSIKIIFTCFNIGSFLLIRNVLKKLGQNHLKAFYLAAHPLVLFELSGNAHGEAVAIFFILAAAHQLLIMPKNGSFKLLFTSSFCLALAIASKLLPLIFLPFFAIFYASKTNENQHFSKPILQYFSATLLFSICLLAPFFAGLSSHLAESIDLYFQKFEYNASFYYLFGFLGKKIVGYNIIGFLGPALSLISAAIIAVLGLRFFYLFRAKKLNALRFFVFLLCATTVYFLFATTVHPWYLTTLVAFGIFTNLRFPMIWAAISMLTYYNYNNHYFAENIFIVFLEYSVLFSFVYSERKKLGLILKKHTIFLPQISDNKKKNSTTVDNSRDALVFSPSKN